MQKVETKWEDEENNRHIEFLVEYTKKDDEVEIAKVTPKQVTFLCPESKSPVRSIGVWTEKGRELLADQLHESGHVTKLEQSLAV